MTTPSAPGTVLPDGRIELTDATGGSVILDPDGMLSLLTWLEQQKAAAETVAAERRTSLRARRQVIQALEANLPWPLSTGTTGRGRYSVTVASAGDVQAWAEFLGTQSVPDSRSDGAEVRTVAQDGALLVATAWAPKPA